jgi:hypothetical protein
MSKENELEEVVEEIKLPTLEETVDIVVNFINLGKADPLKVYPPGRYQGD